MDPIVFTINRPETTLAVTRGAARVFVAMGYAPLLEVRLPNGRRADIMGIGPRGQIAIVEVKSSVEDFRSDQKWSEYLDYCDAFSFAVSPEFPKELLPTDAGLIVADAFDGAVIREPALAGLSGPRRKSITLAFARLAAARLIQLPV